MVHLHVVGVSYTECTLPHFENRTKFINEGEKEVD